MIASSPEFQPNFGQGGAGFRAFARAGVTRAHVKDDAIEFSSPPGITRLTWLESTRAAGANPWNFAEPTGNISYFCNQPAPGPCRDGVPGYRRLERKGLYPGVDWVLRGSGERLEYDLVVHPGADVGQMILQVDGSEPRLEADGSLRAGQLFQWRPKAYQPVAGRQEPVAVALVPDGKGRFRFRLGPHRTDLDVTIDPVVEVLSVDGGSGEDTLAGAYQGSGCNFRYGTTRSADWTTIAGNGKRDVFVVLERPYSNSSRTYFWGGEGDEQVGGSSTDLTNCTLLIAGSTDSKNAPIVAGAYDSRIPKPYAGGASDGFLLDFRYDGLYFASYLGGPGTDRLYDVRVRDQLINRPTYAVAGETDDPAWDGATVRRIGAGGGMDAVVGTLLGPALSVTAIGGAGEDRATRVRVDTDGSLLVAGETSSADFPATAGTQAAVRNDVWVGRMPVDVSTAPGFRLFGGDGDDRLGGIALLADKSVLIAGTSNSSDLPAASGRYLGGGSDGFLAVLDPATLEPRTSTYIGGNGHDEINALEVWGSDVYLGGATDSDNLALESRPAGATFGGTDALFVLCDPFGAPTRAIRFGGTGDDRVNSIHAAGMGLVYAGGTSDSREWLNSRYGIRATSAGKDGFLASLTFGALRFATSSLATPVPGNALFLGKDLQVSVQVRASSEPGFTGLVSVTSSDPGRLLVSAHSGLPGSGRVLLSGVTETDGTWLTLQALGDSGDVDLIFEGVSVTEAASHRQRLRVTLRPSALFLSSLFPSYVDPNGSMEIAFRQAPVLPDGKNGDGQVTRGGLTNVPGLVSSDPTGLLVKSDSLRSGNDAGSYRGTVTSLREGTYTVTPTSTRIPAAEGQTATVIVGLRPTRIFSDQLQVLSRHHTSFYWIDGDAGDSLQAVSSDDSRLLLSDGTSPYGPTIDLAFSSTGSPKGLYLLARAGDGIVTVRLTGTYKGKPLDDTVRIQLVPYTISWSTTSRVAAGTEFNFYASSKPLLSGVAEQNYSVMSMTPYPNDFADLRLHSSDTTILAPETRPSTLSFVVIASRPGTALLSFGPDAPPEFASISTRVTVERAVLAFEREPVYLPAGAAITLQLSWSRTVATSAALRAVRVRVTGSAPLRLEWQGTGTDVMADLSSGSVVRLLGENALAGQSASLWVSAPGVPEREIPVHVVAPVVIPTSTELRVSPSPNRQRTWSYEVGGEYYGQIIRGISGVQLYKKVRARTVVDPPGICTFPETVELPGSGDNGTTFQCAGTGTVTLRLQPLENLSDAQSSLSLRIVSVPDPPAALINIPRILVGKGLQTAISLYGASGAFSGTITSSDPERVRLSSDPAAPGSVSLTGTPARPLGTIYVQGFAAEDTATLTLQSTDGRTATIPVYLFASTWAVRPVPQLSGDIDYSVTVSPRVPLTGTPLSLNLYPFLVEPGSGLLFWTQNLTVRGGSDPFFIKAESSNTAALTTVPPGALINEGVRGAMFQVQLQAAGSATVSVVQPEGFVAAAGTSLEVSVFVPALALNTAPLLSADLQVDVGVQGVGDSLPQGTPLKVTSLDPAKLLISPDRTQTGQESATITGSRCYLQALSTARPGDVIKVRLEAPAFAASEAEVRIVPAELKLASSSPIILSGSEMGTFDLQFGPAPEPGRIASAFYGGVRPGVPMKLHVQSSDPSIVSPTASDFDLAPSMTIPLRAGNPGQARLLMEAPPEIVNRAASVDVTVGQFAFSLSSSVATRYLRSSFTVANPRSRAVTATIRSGGTLPLRYAETAAAPSAQESLTVNLAARETRTLYLEPAGPEGTPTIRVEAEDFRVSTSSLLVQEPRLRLAVTSPFVTTTSAGPATIFVLLAAGTGAMPETALGSSYGPLDVQVESSNPQVVRVSSPTVRFMPGESRRSVSIEPASRGDAIVSLILPAGFSGSSNPRVDLLVTVK